MCMVVTWTLLLQLLYFSHKMVLVLFGTGFLCSPGYPGTSSVDLVVDLEIRDPPASAPQVLGLKVWATTAWPLTSFLLSHPE